MKKQDYKPTGELYTSEIVRSRKRAFGNLEKAKEIEATQMQSGKKYVRIDNRTLKLR